MTEEPHALMERDTKKTAEQQGLFRKFEVRRVDGSDQPGGRHHGCEYFVLDVAHDPHAKAALAAYAHSCQATHPELSKDIRKRYSLTAVGDAGEVVESKWSKQAENDWHGRLAAIQGAAPISLQQAANIANALAALPALSQHPIRATVADYLAGLLRDGRIECNSINCEQMAEQIAALPTAQDVLVQDCRNQDQTEWRPIESAPRDGRLVVIGWYERGLWVEKLKCRPAKDPHRKLPWFWNGQYTRDGDEITFPRATHWRQSTEPPPYIPATDGEVEEFAKQQYDWEAMTAKYDQQHASWELLNEKHKNLLLEDARKILDGPRYLPTAPKQEG